jgi:hypothetical protein
MMASRPEIFAPNGIKYYLYGDSFYQTDGHIRAPVQGRLLARRHRRFNYLMARLRVTVEWTIGKLYQCWEFFGKRIVHKTGSSPLEWRFITGLVLTNAHTTLYSSNAAQYFKCPVLTLEEYLRPMFDEE